MSDAVNLKDLALPFPAEDIEWRVGQAGESNGKVWAKVLAYIQARAIMDRLDAVCGPENWSVSYRMERDSEVTSYPNRDNNLIANTIVPGVIASIGIRTPHGWVHKEDGAEQTDIESFKGGLSGALKRAGACWGIGRYLYGLEADFADVSMERREGFHWAQTKDKKTYYWKPPQLPAWALPKEVNGHWRDELTKIAKEKRLDPQMILGHIREYGVEKVNLLTPAQYGELKARLLSI